MGKLFRFFGGLAAAAAAAAGAAYLLQKKGIVKIEVNYNDKSGNPVTRGYDEMVDTALGTAGKAVSDTYAVASSKVNEVVSDVAGDARDSMLKALDQAGTGLDYLAENLKKGSKKSNPAASEEKNF